MSLLIPDPPTLFLNCRLIDGYGGEPVGQRIEVIRPAPGDSDVAASHGSGKRVGARLDAIGHDRVLGAGERGHALDPNGVRELPISTT